MNLNSVLDWLSWIKYISIFRYAIEVIHQNRTQLDTANSNSVISNSLLFQTRNHFPWICPSVIYYRLFRTNFRFF